MISVGMSMSMRLMVMVREAPNPAKPELTIDY